ncbi:MULTISPECIES: hypothetical protein [unclassified Variovorax]|uniref:hypothetical protein n=1 Tax=unclassified Variovorax TaxID=663243 RepID=UPI00076D8A3E|nr:MULTISPECIES: hypothetical protein [unclassified Variovorax]KWT98500.1 hypothetical protein APY03_0635 [Variovorax sp. WDL1]PNG49824.1 hypothetical protein CHC06_05405 [Variovorax sp. B2]PNG50696.1 hypothetical protein CHC07_05310 [Variovorax sp. B4]VTU42446.1 hypothetical protein H6P1_00188 [Variovorax sp. PBL-H6]VTU43932.1 hypothetical protein SRS16P1_00714 [Variovorax sp. SRS16]
MELIGTIKAYGQDLEVRETRYRDGALAFIVQSRQGEAYGTLSVNVPGLELAEGEFLAKTWSENEPLRAPALALTAFTDTGKRVPVGFCDAEVWVRQRAH